MVDHGVNGRMKAIQIDYELPSGSSSDYNKIITIAGSVMLELIVIIVVAIIILKNRE